MANARSPQKANLVTRRFRLLLDQMRDDLGGGRGWVSVVARRIGVHRSTLIKILDGSRPVTGSMVDRVTDALGLDAAWWNDSTLPDDTSYRQFLPNAGFGTGLEELQDPRETKHPAVSLREAQREARLVVRQLQRATTPDELPELARRLLVAVEAVPAFAAYVRLRRQVENGEVSPEVLAPAVEKLAWGLRDMTTPPGAGREVGRDTDERLFDEKNYPEASPRRL